jgi:RsiW-degrading membrane proteinase PrsW (M82 family)
MLSNYQHDPSPIALVVSGLFVGLFLVLWALVLIVSVDVIAAG